MSQPVNPLGKVDPINPGDGHSHLAAGAKLTGDLSVPGLLELLGHVDGKITADSILIDKSGSATGELRASALVIKGHFDGVIDCSDVKLYSGAKVSGEILYQTLSIEFGAEVNSTCSHRPNGSDSTSGKVS